MRIMEEYRLSEILNTLTINRVPGLNQSTLGNALKRMGIKKKRYATGLRYYVYKVKQDQLDEEAKRIGQEEYNKGIEEAQKRREAGEDVPF